MEYTQCGTCNRIKFSYPDTGEIFWKDLTPIEKGALAIIFTSKFLVAMVGGVSVYPEQCQDCKSAKEN